MKAIVFTEYGSPDVLRLEEVPKPVPEDNEVLIKIHSASVNAADLRILKADPFLVRLKFGLSKPNIQILGSDIAGTVEAVGNKIIEFKPGDEVFGDIFACGLGGFAEYVCVREDALVLKPAKITFEQAAAVPLAAVTALQGLRDKGKIRPGLKVMIHGASGGVGSYAVQIAKSFGAEVTAVCSTRNLEMVRSIGADHTIDYTQEDFGKNGKQYDLILAVNGNRSIWDYRRALAPGGIYVTTGGSMKQFTQGLFIGPWISMTGNKKMITGGAGPNKKDLTFIKEHLESSKVVPVIDKRYPLIAVPEALRYLEEGHAKGKVVINII
ncbi:MAG TPA: NAD(P)-dependent alcohol dehydrogenase [Cyclobacteriaceae bacterium]|nr:NAD(P)-dependent alcohol dehydrogenase [Cyclobacteriaceae bacterium]